MSLPPFRASPLSLFLIALAASATSCAAHAPHVASVEQLPYAGNPPPVQLQVIAPWVGSWALDIQVAPSAQSPQGAHFTGQAVGQQQLHGQFIRVNGQTSNGSTREEYSIVYGYDTDKDVYRRWYFSSIGLINEFEGHWDSARQEMTWKLISPAGHQTATLVESFTADAITTHVTYKDSAGNVARSAVNRATRGPATASQNESREGTVPSLTE
ncbi:hypothetical protein KRR26_19495 [Corallococcus sp. M34]|uniref:hypothetical protein n=1 Tax=Citreicoccus inhibens TaxID=2849499 RepID=UPI001C215492|nr:hypothetical protein [Citreicoccus inhibens]MBU8897805.1 hypothetical protein [Citreicoccus inhibens]